MINLEDEMALRNLMSRYIDVVARRDGDAWAATWCEDGSWVFPGSEVSGRDDILGLWRQMMEGFEFALMMPSSCLFDIDGDSASGHWYLQEHTRDREGNRAMLLSRYQDTYRRETGEWRYLRREYQIIYHGDPDLSGAYMPLGL